MYVFFRVDGLTDSLAFCKRLVREARLGLAPGSAFGPEGEGFVRWCFAADDARLDDGVARLRALPRAAERDDGHSPRLPIGIARSPPAGVALVASSRSPVRPPARTPPT